MIKLELLIKFDWKRIVFSLGLVLKAFDPTQTIMFL